MMKILNVYTCGGCGESKFDTEYEDKGWCLRDRRIIKRYELPDWCPLEDARDNRCTEIGLETIYDYVEAEKETPTTIRR